MFGAATAGAGAMVGATADAQRNSNGSVARKTRRIRMGFPLLGTRRPIYAGHSERSTAPRVGRDRQVRRVFGEMTALEKSDRLLWVDSSHSPNGGDRFLPSYPTFTEIPRART